MLQWGAGGWLLAPEEKKEKDNVEMMRTVNTNEGIDQEAGNKSGIEEASTLLSYQNQTKDSAQNGQDQQHRRRHSHISHILNYEPLLSPSMTAGQEEFGGVRSRRLVLTNNGNNQQPNGYIDSSSEALAMMVRELSFTSLGPRGSFHGSFEGIPSRLHSPNGNGDSKFLLPQPESEDADDGPLTIDAAGGATAALDAIPPTIHEDAPLTSGHASVASVSSLEVKDRSDNFTVLHRIPSLQQIKSYQEADITPLTETLLRIFRKVFQPPVVGALLGLFIASFPNLRGMLENIWGDQGKTAPLQFMFDGIYSVSPSQARNSNL